ncbi:MAG: hypothetical protein ACE5I1_26065, partial [bacterium]
MKKALIFCTVMLFIAACTSNPIDDDNTISVDKTEISGRVTIPDGASPERVYVWLQGYNLGAFTDKNGAYALRLPAEQQGGSGTVQRDTLYFYLANYFIETAHVDIVEGKFRFFSADLDAEGKVRDITMQRALQIETQVRAVPAKIQANPDTIRALVKLRADVGCVVVRNPFVGQQTTQRVIGDTTALKLGALLIKNLDTEKLIILRSTEYDSGAERLNPCDYDTYLRKLDFFAGDVGLLPGNYDATPYLWFEPATVPTALLD